MIHRWDCPCGVPNAPTLPVCRACRRPQSQGRGVYRQVAPVAAPVVELVPPPRWWEQLLLIGFQVWLIFRDR